MNSKSDPKEDSLFFTLGHLAQPCRLDGSPLDRGGLAPEAEVVVEIGVAAIMGMADIVEVIVGKAETAGVIAVVGAAESLVPRHGIRGQTMSSRSSW